MERHAHDFEWESPFGNFKANNKAAIILSIGAVAVVGILAYGVSKNEKILQHALEASKQMLLK
ncbi:hypothetical protein AAL85_24095 [Salmonella enterica subsp. enterica serovar Typhi]|nr:hypothetical protein [Salmonella enterica subsp. enterica serovar Typhi]